MEIERRVRSWNVDVWWRADRWLTYESRQDDLLLTAAVARSLDSAQTHHSLGFTKGIGAYGLRVAAGRSSGHLDPRACVWCRGPERAIRSPFPVIATGEIDGTVVVVDGGRKRSIGGIALELVDAQRRVVARATTASDGCYTVEAVPPGTFQLRIPRQQLRPLWLIDSGVRIVTLSVDGDFLKRRRLRSDRRLAEIRGAGCPLLP